jgi:hypothetical protein
VAGLEVGVGESGNDDTRVGGALGVKLWLGIGCFNDQVDC